MSRAFVLLGTVVPVFALALVPARGDPPAASDMLDPWPHPKGYVCYRPAKPITIDGELTAAEWDAAPWTDDFVDIEGDKRPKPRFRTRAKMQWDDEALYIAAELAEPHVWGTLTAHDAVIFQDPDFEVFIDPDGDNHAYGELEVNALNTTWDLLLTKPYKDGGRAVDAWEITGLKTAVKVRGTINDSRDTDTGWTLEIRWPWKSLQELSRAKLPPKDGEQIRINFSRVEWDIAVVKGKYEKVPKTPEHNWVWSPQGVIDMHRPERWGYLQFSTAKPGEGRFAPDPDWELRDVLHRAYYGQRVHQKKHGKFTAAPADLGLKPFADRLKIETTRTGFEVTATDREGKPRYAITSDGHIRRE